MTEETRLRGERKTHYLKCWTEFYNQVEAGFKPWELRINDRDYHVGDEVVLQDFDNETKEYSGREITGTIDFLLAKSPWLHPGYCIFTFRILHPSGLAHTEQKGVTSKIPEWWPECPYPESVFTMTTKRFIEAIPDETLRTSISGYCGRIFWNIASKAIFNAWKFDRDFGDTCSGDQKP